MGMYPGQLAAPQAISLWDARAKMADMRDSAPDARLLELLGALPPHGAALDIGCGCGRHLLALAQAGWRATGLDCSNEALTFSRHLVEEQGQVCTLVKGDFHRLPFEPGSFALVVSTNTLQHGSAQDFKRALQEIKRVLKIGGSAFISVPSLANRPSPFSSRWIDEQTAVLTDGAEAGILHHFFSEPELLAAAGQFRERAVAVELRPFPRGYKAADGQLNEWLWLCLKG